MKRRGSEIFAQGGQERCDVTLVVCAAQQQLFSILPSEFFSLVLGNKCTHASWYNNLSRGLRLKILAHVAFLRGIFVRMHALHEVLW